MAKTYRIAVIGRTGRGDYGHGLDSVWRDVSNTKVVAVADDDRSGLAAAAKRLGLDDKAAYADYRRMLDDVKPDVAAVGTRWLDAHRDMVVAAAQRGIHVYCEKPLCRTLAEADEMIDACERTHAKLAIAFQTRYSPKIDVVQKLIADGRIGQVLEYRARGKEDARGGSEDLWVLGTHVLDMVRLFGGGPTWCLGHVTQGGRPIVAADVKEGSEGIGPLAGDAVRAMYAMPGGATAYFASHRGAGGNPSRFGLVIYGSRGAIEIGMGYLPTAKLLPDSSWSPGRSGSKWLDISSAGVDKPEPIKDGSNHVGNVLAVKDLLDAIENNRQPKAGIHDARAAVELIVAVFDSQRLGGPVDLPLKNRQNPLTMLEKRPG
jgi:predicted dehydrogenase